MASTIETPSAIETITVDEGMKMLDREAREYLGISGEEFIRRYKAADLAELVARDPSAVSFVSMSLPLAGVPLDAWKQTRRGA